jgi:hypothetical protein
MTGKGIWKLIDEKGSEHKHKYLEVGSSQPHQSYGNGRVNSDATNRPIIRERRRVVDLSVVTDTEQARKLLTQGWTIKHLILQRYPIFLTLSW